MKNAQKPNRNIVVLLFTVFMSLAAGTAFTQDFSLGVDLSYVNELEDCGTTYYDETGTARDPYLLLAEKGASLVRLRLWHDPKWTSYSNFEDIQLASSRTISAGMDVLLDLHYSDFWADPSRQWRPEAWNNISNDDVLGDSVYNYTYHTLRRLIEAELTPSVVQLGNEVNGNILIRRTTQAIDGSSPGISPVNWSRQVALLQRGIDAVQQINSDFNTDIKSLIHVAQPQNSGKWFATATTYGLSGYDVIGLSYYPQWSDYEIRDVGEHISYLAETYGKEVMIVETGYPWTLSNSDGANNVVGSDSRLDTYGRVISREVQRDFMIELTYLVKQNGGSGIVYWEPAWVSSECETYWAKGSHWDNVALFDFDNRLHTGADFLGYDYSIMPAALEEKLVTFSVNMKGVDTANGVYVTGDFTGRNWQFKAMNASDDEIYSYSAFLPGRTMGAYIFYTNNEWNDQFREEVPSACADYWETHRKYVIEDRDTVFKFSWGSCNAIPLSSQRESTGDAIRYLPGEKTIAVNSALSGGIMRIMNISGQLTVSELNAENRIPVAHLPAGLYILTISNSAGIHDFKFVR